ncbi:MAG: hypothetical protein B7Y12_03830 [Rhizobiales bacterium 24-66-13]|jgi:hypothetical protein|nr:MAG: hypothetical protein B7Z41_06500 [Rhizobiales bacterium 12-66-7]OYY88147.1 MAG: hypothetical protein B7Y61_03545 [Rhizobiales bacterium 35-66-30]OYZ82360.1 MAG: hypothetical protein B7Y12_03830 [Rhizobiales bacterium 24-66-13]OZB10708.1 MAG: hypothetical protein B7X67_06095 [Rhizobiales bacterium 39-66-18]
MLDGHVEIALQGEAVTLVPSLGAAMTLNRTHQSFGSLLAKLESYDLQACIDVVHFGLGRTDAQRNQTAEEVFATGMVEMVPDLIKFAIRLANGGKAPKIDEVDPSAGPFAA